MILAPASTDDLSLYQGSETVRVQGVIFDEGGVDRLKIAGEEILIRKDEKVQPFEADIPLFTKATFLAVDRAGNVTEGNLDFIWDEQMGLQLPDTKPHRRALYNPSEEITVCYKGTYLPFALSKKVTSEKGPKFYIEECPTFVFEPLVTITGKIESTGEILDIWINDRSILATDDPASLLVFFRIMQKIVRGGRTRFYFTRTVSLKKGKNFITIRAQDKEGLSDPQTIRVEYRVREIEKIGNRWQLAILPLKKQRMKYPFFIPSTPSSIDSLYDELIDSFFKTKRFDLVERERIDALVRELGLHNDEVVDAGKELKMATSQGRGFADGIYVEEFDGQDPCLEIKTRLVDGADGRILATHDVYNRWRNFEDEEYLLSGLSQKYLEYFPIVQGSLLEIKQKGI